MNPITLYLADDHQILIDGLVAFFQTTENIEVIGNSNNGLTLLRELHTKKPDIVLLDLNMPKFDGLKTLERISKDFPSIKVIVLSNYNQANIIKEARNLGAQGYLLKNGSKNELLDAITAVSTGGSYFPIDSEKEVEVSELFTDEFKKKYQLTKREVEIIRMICKEFTSREIADKLFISEFTVTTHRRNILGKLDIKNLAGLINFAKEQGIC